ncbi:hypothetical protein DSCO28_01670 [Desulfosarcina ovata subsp. sediminis]|uniref:Uncharacterized protein n=1 Tax=Desulfosarcina ovata subsp. sediminis TaxID=885957 RepID=A0A5K7ZFA1_9BACT|nr:hypothetical protein DSCO28_01670 [Desulfosarcina ovata subsp. sediminis]
MFGPGIPLIGTIAAGQPMEVIENLEKEDRGLGRRCLGKRLVAVKNRSYKARQVNAAPSFIHAPVVGAAPGCDKNR